jgi:hypothetical protein
MLSQGGRRRGAARCDRAELSPATRVSAVAQYNQQKYEDALATTAEVVNRQSDVPSISPP